MPSKKTHVIKRQWEMLRIIPRLPLKITAAELHSRLLKKGFDIDPRSVQRDLVTLEEYGFGIVQDGGLTRGWSYGRHAPTQLHGLDLNTALTLKLADAHVRQLVPASILGDLEALVKTAEKSLEGTGHSSFARWPDKIRVLASGPVRTPPRVDPKVHSAVSEALLKNLRLSVQYRSVARTVLSTYVISPLGMVLKGGVIYIVASREDKVERFTLALHRILKAEIHYSAAKVPSDWTGLDDHIATGQFLYPPGPVQKDCLVTLRFDSLFVQNIREMPLSADQTIKEERKLATNGQPCFRVRARVTVSGEFVRWLLQYGDHVEVLRPLSLRKRMATIVSALHARYLAAT
jgi:predicted DNA-binding transcriptional regulator YafY